MEQEKQTGLYGAVKSTGDISAVNNRAKQRKKRRKVILLVLLALLVGFGIFLCTKPGALWLHLMKIRMDYRISTTGLNAQTAAEIEVTDGFVIHIAEFGGEKRASDSRSVLYLVSFGYREYGVWHFSQVGDASAGKGYGNHAGNAPQFSLPFVSQLGDYTVITRPIREGHAAEVSAYDSIGTKPVFVTNAFSKESAESAAWWEIIYGMKENDPPVMTGRTDFDCGMEVYVIEDMPEDYVFTYDEGTLTADEIRSLVGE